MMPVVFVGHGNPMYAIEESEYAENWRNLGEKLLKPQAIIVISAHWETVGTKVTAMKTPRTIHDFYGFPQALFEVEYNASGDPELATEIAEKTSVNLDYDWGLDHGTWAVLRHIYPKADVPVIQISLDRKKSAEQHFQFARDLQFLRSQSVLIIGSGNIVHNLRLINFRQKTGDSWAIQANEILKNLVFSDEYESLINYQNLNNKVQTGIPTPEHYLPLLYVLALKNKGGKNRNF